MIALEIRSASKDFKCRDGSMIAAFHDVNLTIPEGESLGLVGESGSGKSTLALCICALLPLTSGSIRLNGQPWSDLQGRRLRQQRWRLQLVFQDPYRSLNPYMSVRRIVEDPLLCLRQDERSKRREKVENLLRDAGLEEELWDRMPNELSGGQRQRVAIARALAPGPQLLVADEPVSSLDPDTSLEILGVLDRLTREHRLSLLLISHDLSVVRGFCERTAVMYQGRIVELQDTEALFVRPNHPYTRKLLDAGGGMRIR